MSGVSTTLAGAPATATVIIARHMRSVVVT